MMMELWLVAEAESKHEMLRAQAERDRLARQLAKVGRPLRVMLAAVLRRIADGIDARTGVVVRQEPYVSFLAE